MNNDLHKGLGMPKSHHVNVASGVKCSRFSARLLIALITFIGISVNALAAEPVIPVPKPRSSVPGDPTSANPSAPIPQTPAAMAGDPYAEVAYPPVNYGSGPEAEQIRHGEYLAKAGDCIACHTTPGGKPFAGGFPIKTPFGTIYSQNITPDKETGIGNWSDEDFIKVMREGISPHGDYYYPVFPFVYFNKLSRQDVIDIKRYLHAIPAVKEANRPLDMPFPFNIRTLQSFWRFMFFDFQKGEFIPDERKSPEWNRGAYLVQGLGHCAMCHTQLNALGAAKTKYNLAGGFVDGYAAPNISASGLKDFTTQQVVDVFLKDVKPRGGKVQGPMLQVNHDSLRYLSIEDLTAIVTYLKTVQSELPPVKAASGSDAGKGIYEQYCAACHTSGGGGAPKLGDAAAWSPLAKLGTSKLYTNAIHGIAGMPPKGNCDSCTDDQIKQAVDYILGKSGSGEGKAAAPAAPSAQSITSIARGKQVYEQVCSVCHNQGQLGAPKLGDAQAWSPIMQNTFDVLVDRAVHGYKGHPAMGACYKCTDADIISAVKYMAQESGTGDYRLW